MTDYAEYHPVMPVSDTGTAPWTECSFCGESTNHAGTLHSAYVEQAAAAWEVARQVLREQSSSDFNLSFAAQDKLADKLVTRLADAGLLRVSQ